MKTAILTLVVSIFSLFGYSQDKKYTILGKVKKDILVKAAIVGYPSAFLEKETTVYVSSTFSQQSLNYFEFYHNDKRYIIESKDLYTINSFENISSFSDNEKDSLRNRAKYNSNLMYGYKRSEALAALNAHKVKGLSILNWSYYDESEYTEGTSLKIKVLNPTNKIVKYIWFSFIGYNPVGDKVISKGTSVKTVKAVGPIKPGEISEYKYEYVWFTDLVETAKIYSIKVQYMDGTFKTILDPKSIILNENFYNILFDTEEE